MPVSTWLPRRIAEQFVAQTVRLVNYYLKLNDEDHHIHLSSAQPSHRRAAPSSRSAVLPGEGRLHALSRFIWAAYERSVELGGGRLTPENKRIKRLAIRDWRPAIRNHPNRWSLVPSRQHLFSFVNYFTN
jgi:hypothetical protein